MSDQPLQTPKVRPVLDLSKYPEKKWADLEEWAIKSRDPFGGTFDATFPIPFFNKCHEQFAVLICYWDGFIYLTCSQCAAPICKIAVSKSLL